MHPYYNMQMLSNINVCLHLCKYKHVYIMESSRMVYLADLKHFYVDLLWPDSDTVVYMSELLFRF